MKEPNKLIDKDALVAEIKRRIKERDFQMKSGCWISSTYMYEDLLDFINTLEVKEVNLEKEAENFVKTEEFVKNGNPVLAIATHFFELGLRTQKGE